MTAKAFFDDDERTLLWKLLSSCPESAYLFVSTLMYVIRPHVQNKLINFLDHWKSIQFTFKTDAEGNFLFLYIDTYTRPAGFWCSRLYMKPTYIKEYTNVTSESPFGEEADWPFNLVRNIITICDLKIFDAELE